ncbi:excinuclease ABC subunit UvrA [Runella slithyformis]|uniref:UvrABC system protein A n=1 Tax=Runella slithyformis (strain ATCC 29530 / DSM 19594 / LMG 11500 / NCIMB 11436 / LSU 4) TaxID=761193 RepID=A0A7U3ZI85_RUNSL|nr:excinuclease ABC subunit UvrA [Runella slithyformis]AEI47697.1 excinuclease ABC, A subunit [Runella slithyformis DSM 19594]
MNVAENQQNISDTDFENLNPKHYIIIKGARVNNLKNIDVAIPRNKLIVVTGVSGSGKSSLAFDTLFAEGQRMYVESLSSYARQFLGRMEKPEVDYIKGVSPAVAIEQKVNTRNPRSTVGTTTEIYDYLKLLFARVGTTYSPFSGLPVRKDTVTDVVDFMLRHEEGTRVRVLAPLIIKENRTIAQELSILLSKGYTRVVVNKEMKSIEELMETNAYTAFPASDFFILIDRAAVKHDDEDTQFRLSDSVQTAFFEGEGLCIIEVAGGERREFSDKFELDGLKFEEPSVNLFSFNNPYGACKRCEGFGKVLGLDPDLIVPDKNLSVFEGAIAPWRTEKMSEWLAPLLRHGIRFDFPIHRAYKDLTQEQKDILWTGNQYFEGLNAFFEHLESQTHKVQYRVMLSRYRGRTTCPECRGSRLRKDAGYVKINGMSITDLVLLPIGEVLQFFKALTLPDHEFGIAKRILIEIEHRLEYMERVGLGYLTLNRLTSTLSGGEFQRIKLATSLGSALVGSMYILDEPSIGLHPRDTRKLVGVLESLRDMGNTVIVVEHEEEVMRAADQIIDIGPDAGNLGGEVVWQGTWEDILNPIEGRHSHTIRFLNGEDQIPVPTFRRKSTHWIELTGARENNLKDVDVKFPLGTFTVVTGVSGSGKSTLIRKILFPALARQKGEYNEEAGKYTNLTGSIDRIDNLEMVDQNPIGKSSRSNPVTYIKAYDYIRQMMSEVPLAKARGYKPSHFSFNIEGGRCETCQGEGQVKIEMQFMADIYLKCEACGGKRFKQEILDVRYQGRDESSADIADILDMTIDEAITFFRTQEPKLADRLLPLQEVGLGYVKLGQSSNTLSGGEAQRVKLAFFLSKSNPNQGRSLFIFDEPTTGLHFHDIQKLLKALNALVNQGDTVIVIEHNVEVIKSADWVIDMGPEGGEAGGYVTFEGTPEDMIKLSDNYTAAFLKEKMNP